MFEVLHLLVESFHLTLKLLVVLLGRRFVSLVLASLFFLPRPLSARHFVANVVQQKIILCECA